MNKNKLLIIVSGLLISAQPLFAHDHINLERGIPVMLEDAYPTAYMNREIQGYTRYERTSKNEDNFVVTPVLEYGFIRNGELELEIPTRFGEEKDQESGNLNFGGLYNFLYEGLYMPAPAISAQVAIPTGANSSGADTRLGFLLTKTLSRSTYFHRLHFNAYWHNNDKPGPSERLNYYEFALGYQMRMGQNNQLLVNVLQQQQQKKTMEAATVIEVGIRHQWNPLWVIAAGVGAGVSHDAPDMVATIGFQKAMNFFWDSP
jgi:hypothetical protein